MDIPLASRHAWSRISGSASSQEKLGFNIRNHQDKKQNPATTGTNLQTHGLARSSQDEFEQLSSTSEMAISVSSFDADIRSYRTALPP
jgi:hypothetical protein